jgi:hypothetical protein
MLLLCRIHREIASGQIHDSKKKTAKNSTSTQLLEIFCTDTNDMLILSSTVTSLYYNCIGGSTSPGNYVYLSYAELNLSLDSRALESPRLMYFFREHKT